jgi:hypothetical protein
MRIEASWGIGPCHTSAARALVLALLVAAPACSSRVIDAGSDGGSAPAPATDAGAPATEPEEELPPPPALAWCDVQPIIADKCGRCHGKPTQNGAPFSLIDYADTQAVDSHGRRRYERMQTAIETDLMPALFVKLEPPAAPLTEAERRQLLDWLAAQAPLSPDGGGGDAESCVAAR